MAPNHRVKLGRFQGIWLGDALRCDSFFIAKLKIYLLWDLFGKTKNTTVFSVIFRLRTENLLRTFFGEDPEEDDGDCQQCSQNIKVGHERKIIIHSYSLLKIMLVSQKIEESTSPKEVSQASNIVAFDTRGPTMSDAKNTWPISRDIWESASGLISGAIYAYHTSYDSLVKLYIAELYSSRL